MFYHILKILHIISAALLLTSAAYTIKLWLTSTDFLDKIQTQTWNWFIPTTLFQLATGFTMISLKQYDLSEYWIIGSMAGFMVLIISWFGFLYVLLTSSSNKKNGFYSALQISLLIVFSISLLFIIFLMTNKVKNI